MAGKPPFEIPDDEYAGDISCRQAWDALASDSDALLVDVRTKVEWQLIGRPDLSSLGKEPVYLQWVTMEGVNQNFPNELKAALDERGANADTPVYFMCQSGGRSKMSAMQCTELGYTKSFNIAEGFEGDLDEQRHRNSISGWKVAGLPWTQA
ncbi:MAG: sulfurtransferase [Chromatiales bacterium]|jgi:rhodanese-related sulfurtransferase|nr:sulfurtransferase [Chromatiales bacterium]MDP6151216.1 rhodanese-like domain-containing protein [Gammaproteobacteria bacterium]MDP7270649.1 rhodanese-like domain-containing protein [Gammaproteobacteria bacterium]HJP04287.1 rhodanese-like domain-containing protein [Gammaproteobacteria bacterium]